MEGANAAELSKKVAKYAQSTAAPAVGAGATTTQQSDSKVVTRDLNTRLKELVNSAECVAFIKGTPKEPRCGFTRQLVELFERNNVEYTTFNILADEEVRQGTGCCLPFFSPNMRKESEFHFISLCQA